MPANPYIEVRREWDERCADLALGKRKWQIAADGLLLAVLILAIGMVWLSTRRRYIPYIVEVDKLGYALTVPQPLAPALVPDAATRVERDEGGAAERGQRRRRELACSRDRSRNEQGSRSYAVAGRAMLSRDHDHQSRTAE
jgi:hypothetical protein